MKHTPTLLLPWLKLYAFVYENEAELVPLSEEGGEGQEGACQVIRVPHIPGVGGIQHLSQRENLIEHIHSLGFGSNDNESIHQIPTDETFNTQVGAKAGEDFGVRAKFIPIDSLRLAPEETLKFLMHGTLPLPVPSPSFVESLTLEKDDDRWKMLIDHVIAPVHDMAVYGLNFHFLPKSMLTEAGDRLKSAQTREIGLEIPPTILLGFYRQDLNIFCQDIWCRIEAPEQFPLAADKAASELWTRLDDRIAQAERIVAAPLENRSADTSSGGRGRGSSKKALRERVTEKKLSEVIEDAGLRPWMDIYRFIYEHEPRLIRLKRHETPDSPPLYALHCPHVEDLGGFDQLGQVPNLIEHVYNLGFGSHDGKRLDQMPLLETFQALHAAHVGEQFGPEIMRVESPLRRIHIEDRVKAYINGRFPFLFTSADFFRSVALTKNDDRWTALVDHVARPLIDLSVSMVNFHYLPRKIWDLLGDKFRHAIEEAPPGMQLDLAPILAFYHKDLNDFCHQVWFKAEKASDFPEIAQDRLEALQETQTSRIAQSLANSSKIEDPKAQSDPAPLGYDDQEMNPFENYEEAPPEIAKTGKASGGDIPRPAEKTQKAAASRSPGTDTPPGKGLPRPKKSTHWSDRIRDRLLDQPRRALRLSEIIPKEELPTIGCILPWTRLELGMNQQYGPCCTAYQVEPGAWSRTSNLDKLWNGPVMQSFRRALASDNPYTTCRETCPKLQGGSHLPASLELRGGPDFFIERQITLVEDLLDGKSEVRAGPLEICFPTTTYCNYDCLMCVYGQIGTLEDELPESFYVQLGEMIPGMYLIEALGGEPLASKVFRDFLADFDFPAHPHLRMSLITNGSYLTPKEQERLAHVPFTNLTCSLNAATPETYLLVNRGLPWDRARENLDELLRRRHEGVFGGAITYSMVLLKSNYHEIRLFAELARKDGVQFRYMLPMHNLNDESIMTDSGMMEESFAALELIAQEEWKRGQWHAAREMLGEARVLKSRLDRGIFRPIPDDDTDKASPPPRDTNSGVDAPEPLAPDFAARGKRLSAASTFFQLKPGAPKAP